MNAPENNAAFVVASVLRRFIERVATLQGEDVSELMKAARESRALLARRNVPVAVRLEAEASIDGVIDVALRWWGILKSNRDDAKKAVSRFALKAFLIAVNGVVLVALFYTPFQYASIIPLTGIMWICGFKYPVKACVALYAAFRRATKGI